MKYLVTGGAGFIGSNLVDVLIANGHQVSVIDNFSTGKKENLNSGARVYQKDTRNYSEIEPLFAGVDGVFHLAAMPSVQFSVENPVESHDINVNGMLNVLTAAWKAKVRRVVYSSSCSVYGDAEVSPQYEDLQPDPNTPYALHKYIGEEYCRLFSFLYGLETVSLRYFNVYGPRMADTGPYSGVIKIFMKQKAAGQPLTITGDGEQSRDLVFVGDIVRANILAMESEKVGSGELINIGTGKAYSVNKIADIIGGPRQYVTARVELRHSLADIQKAKKLLGWQPTISLEEGLRALLG